MKNTEYNGWTNYATWRVNLEIFDGWNSGKVDADFVKDFAETITLSSVEDNTLAYGYVTSFLSDVNWHEISNAINENLSE